MKQKKNDCSDDFARHLLQTHELNFSKKFEKLDSSHLKIPMNGHVLFIDENHRKEWDEADPSAKSFIMKHLHETTKNMEAKIAIEMLCLVIDDLIVRIENIEQRKK